MMVTTKIVLDCAVRFYCTTPTLLLTFDANIIKLVLFQSMVYHNLLSMFIYLLRFSL